MHSVVRRRSATAELLIVGHEVVEADATDLRLGLGALHHRVSCCSTPPTAVKRFK